MTNYRVAILTVSDTAARDAAADKTGPLLENLFAQNAAFARPVTRRIVSDDITSIQKQVQEWSQSGVALCITTGGTGFSKRDVTPEAVRPLIEKEATGFVHVMLKTSLEKTPMAALARPVAGATKDGMIVVTVPGSPKGAVENVQALLNLLPHALDLASGGTGKAVHAAMGMPSRAGEPASQHSQHTCSHSHSHHHGHHAPKPRTLRSMDTEAGPSARHRQSQYPIISLQEAYAQIFDQTDVLPEITRAVDTTLVGSILAEDVHAEQDLPVTETTNVDGYAVAAAKTSEGVYPVLMPASYASLTGGGIFEKALPDGYICRINTGGPLPKGTDAVIMVEDTELVSSTAEGEEKEVRLLAQVQVGENVRKPGSDVRKDDLILAKGSQITGVGGEIGSLAFIGKREVKVYRKPTVAIMSTGNEITDLHAAATHQDNPVIHDSNRPSLQVVLESHGFEVVDLGIIADDAHATETALRRGCRDADVIITTGGTSMGEGDMLKPVIERNLHGTIHFGRVAMKPGKPTTFATIPASSLSSAASGQHQRDKQIFALPGNPASALVTFHLFVLPCLRKLSGFPTSAWHLPTVKVQATSAMRLDPRPEFHRVSIQPISEPPYLVARSTGGQRSSRTVSLAYANGLVCLPSSSEKDKKDVVAGDIVDAILIGQL